MCSPPPTHTPPYTPFPPTSAPNEQLRKVNSTVHLTGKPTEDTKNALSRLLQSSKYVSRTFSVALEAEAHVS